jgi:ribosomal protein L32
MNDVRNLAIWEFAVGGKARLDGVEPTTTASSPSMDHDCGYYRQPDGVCAYCGEERPAELSP